MKINQLAQYSLILPLAIATVFSPALQAKVIPSPLFSDNVVLQREAAVPVWGRADAGETVTVTFVGQTQTAVADSQGKWEVRLTPMPANVTGTLTIRGKNVVTLKNVVTGDVWLCSGQSNMALKVRDVTNAVAEIAAANQPEIRQLLIPCNPSPEPQPDVWIKGVWQPASPKTAGDFTAAGYFFAREIHAWLGVPVGLINSSVGGTPIQSWMALEILKVYPGYAKLLERKKMEMAAWPTRKKQLDAELKAWETNAALAQAAHKPVPDKPWNPGPPDSGRFMPGQLYNGMIHPLIHYCIKGALWYQGEANAGGGAGGAADYTDLQSRLIAGWRQDWSLGNLPFYFVQLPNWDNVGDASRNSWAFFREGQAKVLKVPNTGMAVTIDIGDNSNIHPKNKQEAGRRLALVALAGVYGQSGITLGPVYAGSVIEGASIRVRFDFAAGGLLVHGQLPPLGFEIAGSDGKFFSAMARIETDSVVVRAAAVPKPAFVRYAWADNPPVNLFNAAGLPVAPFRTDNLQK